MIRNLFIVIIVFFVTFFFLSCEDNVDSDNPLIGKWIFDFYKGDVKTNVDSVSEIIAKDMEKVNNLPCYQMMYQFMSDGRYILFDMDSDYKTTGSYVHEGDTIFLEENDKCYKALYYTGSHNFTISQSDEKGDYTVDSLRALGVKEPESVIIERAILTAVYKRIEK